MIEIFLANFVSLLVIVDPLGTAAIFMALTAKYDDKQRFKIAFKAAVIAASLLLFFGLAGKYILLHMGISLDAFRIAGGLLLFVTAFRMIMGFHDSDSIDSEDSCYKDVSTLAVFPLAIPLLAGPGCMTATILYMNHAETFAEKGIVLSSIILAEIVAFICLISAARISAVIGKTGASLLARLMGVILAALGVQFIADGILNIVKI